jgi:DHA1 family multidrug resistance protein-like MFS transporter
LSSSNQGQSTNGSFVTVPAWRRNLYVVFMVQLISTAGFSLVFPFLPLYVKELGVASGGALEFWAGLVFSAQAFTMMIASPIWGALADRHGRKVMLERATFGGAVLLLLMGLAQNAEQLVILRAIQGLVSGVISAANALVAASAPRERSGEALGLLQTSRWVGVSGGPILGGFLGDAFGFRESFWITAFLLGLAGVATVLWVEEEFTATDKARQISFWAGYRALVTAPGMTSLYSLTFLRSLGATVTLPVASLYVVSLLVSESGAAGMTGLVQGATAFASALSASWFGRLGDRYGHQRILIGAAVAAAVLYLPQALVTAAWQLVALQALSGSAVGGLLPATAALMNLWAPTGNQGATYGLDNSVQAAARSVAPMVGALVALWVGLRGVYASAALLYIGIALVAWWLVGRTQQAPQPAKHSISL